MTLRHPGPLSNQVDRRLLAVAALAAIVGSCWMAGVTSLVVFQATSRQAVANSAGFEADLVRTLSSVRDRSELQRNLQLAVSPGGIQEALLVDVRGTILAATNPSWVGQSLRSLAALPSAGPLVAWLARCRSAGAVRSTGGTDPCSPADPLPAVGLLPLFGSRELVRTRATTLPFALDYGAEEAALLATSVDLAPLRHRSKILAFELFLAGVLPLLIASAGLMLVVRRAVLPELFHLAQTDSLSGVYNRRAFLETAASLLAKDQLLRKPCVLAILDVDRFKMINDTHGHGVGDEVIRHVSDLLLGMVRRTDVVGRLGGDEFALLLEASGPDARQRFEGIRLAVNAVPFGYPDSLCVPLALSIGMACSDGRAGYRLAALMEEADAALYAAKKQGRNQVVQLER